MILYICRLSFNCQFCEDVRLSSAILRGLSGVQRIGSESVKVKGVSVVRLKPLSAAIIEGSTEISTHFKVGSFGRGIIEAQSTEVQTVS